jgi:hypothetical protein
VSADEVGTLFRRAQPRIEEALIQEYAVPAEARSVSVSIDRVALPMEEPIEAPPVPVDPPWVAAVMAAAPPHPPEVQAVLDEQNQGDEPKVARNFRMAYAATVTLHDAEGESIHTIRYGRMPKGDVRGLCRGLGPLAKPVQIVGVVGVRAAANTNRNAAPNTRGHGARTAA